jgi:hypothetical protein
MDTSTTLWKFGHWVEGEALPFEYPEVYSVQSLGETERLAIAVRDRQVALLIELLEVLPEPFGMLYVLLESHRGYQPARYQSPEPTGRAETAAFLRAFSDYFERDGRHHLWLMSLPGQSTLVYDRHNVIYAYGPIDAFRSVLTARGLKEGKIPFPTPHVHRSHRDFDEGEEGVMTYCGWMAFAL